MTFRLQILSMILPIIFLVYGKLESVICGNLFERNNNYYTFEEQLFLYLPSFLHIRAMLNYENTRPKSSKRGDLLSIAFWNRGEAASTRSSSADSRARLVNKLGFDELPSHDLHCRQFKQIHADVPQSNDQPFRALHHAARGFFRRNRQPQFL